MSRRTCILVALVVLALVLFVWAWPRRPLTREQIVQIKEGMSISDAHRILGSPMSVVSLRDDAPGAGGRIRVFHLWKHQWPPEARLPPPFDKALFVLEIRNEKVYGICYWPDDNQSFPEKIKRWVQEQMKE